MEGNKMTTAFSVEKFKDLMVKASTLNEEAKIATPVFHDVPKKLRDFAAKTLDVLEATAKVSISSLKELRFTRSSKDPINLDTDKPDMNIPFAINWIADLLKDVLAKLDEHGDIIRVHTDVLANPHEAMDVPKSEELKTLKKENDKLRTEIDETRQRGIKGNIIVSCPARNDQPSKAVHREVTEGGNKVKESDTDLVLRLIQEKTDITIPKEDVVACHPMGLRERNTFVIRFINRKPGSAWERLTACMMKPSNMKKNVTNIFINFQLTDKRAALAKAVRTAKSGGKVTGYSINQNGVIKIKKIGETNYSTVSSMENLNGMLVDK
jgi:hypothetical protein